MAYINVKVEKRRLALNLTTAMLTGSALPCSFTKELKHNSCRPCGMNISKIKGENVPTLTPQIDWGTGDWNLPVLYIIFLLKATKCYNHVIFFQLLVVFPAAYSPHCCAAPPCRRDGSLLKVPWCGRGLNNMVTAVLWAPAFLHI